MKYIKEANYFLNEGAKLDPRSPNQIIISYENDRADNNEVLKTTDRSIGIEYISEFPTYFGLTYKTYAGRLDHDGRIKSTMDLLKSMSAKKPNRLKLAGSNKIGSDALAEFLGNNFKDLGILHPEYVCVIGSTEGLSSLLGRAVSMIQTDGPTNPPIIVSLNKVVYLNALGAYSFVQIRSQIEDAQAKGDAAGTLKLAKSTILNYIKRDTPREKGTPVEIIRLIKSAVDIDELEKVLTQYGVEDHQYYNPEYAIVFKDRDTNGKTLIPFVVRSTGRDGGGARTFWKSKYNYREQQFLEAVEDCIINKKRMLIVDDNKNSGEDIKVISKSLNNIIDEFKKSGRITAEEYTKSKKRFAFYLLYDMHHEISAAGKIKDKVEHTKASGERTSLVNFDSTVVRDFAAFIRDRKRRNAPAVQSTVVTDLSSDFARMQLFNSVIYYYRGMQPKAVVLTSKEKEKIFKEAWSSVLSSKRYSSMASSDKGKKLLKQAFISYAKNVDWFKFGNEGYVFSNKLEFIN
jgi:hypothetical protein